jgi:hypothetical protein
VSAVARACGAAALVVAGACHESDYLSYSWDDRRVLCSDAFDDFEGNAPWALIEDELGYARDGQRVALFHAHKPGVTISIAGIERILALADKNHLDYLTYRELEPGPARAGIALGFDDNAVEEWLGIRDLLAAHHARVTFFVSRYTIITDDERAGLDVLAADGHDLEPHSVTHPHGLAYVKANGVDAYMADEALPSMQVLGAAGYAPTTYAYPFGEHTDAMDAAVLSHVGKVRVSPGSCPW